MFDRLGRPSFFDQAVDLVMERLTARIEEQGSANSKNPSCASAPQGDWIRGLAQEEAVWLRQKIEQHFILTGRLGLSDNCTE